jgi:hypothetical protein
LHGSSCFQLIDLSPKIKETDESQIVIMPARYSLICRMGDVNAAEQHRFSSFVIRFSINDKRQTINDTQQ